MYYASTVYLYTSIECTTQLFAVYSFAFLAVSHFCFTSVPFVPQVRFAVTVDTATPTAQPFQTKKKGGYWHISFEEFNSTKSQDFLEQIAAKLQTAEKPINYWMTER